MIFLKTAEVSIDCGENWETHTWVLLNCHWVGHHQPQTVKPRSWFHHTIFLALITALEREGIVIFLLLDIIYCGE